MMTHDMFVFAAYAVTALVVAIMIGWVLVDQHGRKAELAELEARGIRRRSQK